MAPRKYFKFTSEIGWREIISILAIILAAYSILQNYYAKKPNILISTLPVRSYVTCNPLTKEWLVNAMVPIRIINNGEKATVLTGLRKNQSNPTVLATTINGSKYPNPWNVIVLAESAMKNPKLIDSPPENINAMISSEQRIWPEQTPGNV